jgi:hypothetical protein
MTIDYDSQERGARARDQLLKALQKRFPVTAFTLFPGEDSLFVEWDSGPQVSEIRAVAASVCEDRVRLCTRRWAPCFLCATWDGNRAGADIVVCGNCGRVVA